MLSSRDLWGASCSRVQVRVAELVPPAEHVTPEAVAALTAWHDNRQQE